MGDRRKDEAGKEKVEIKGRTRRREDHEGDKDLLVSSH